MWLTHRTVETRMQFLGNVCLCLAALIYLIPWQFVLNEPGRGSHAGGALLWASIILVLPMGALLTVAMSVVAAQDGLQWLIQTRSAQYLAIVAAGLAMTVVVGLSAALRLESVEQMPWAIRPWVPLAAWVLPPVWILTAAFMLNGVGMGALMWLRGAWLIGGVFAVAVAMGLVLQALQSWIARQEAHWLEEAANRQRRDIQILTEVQAMDINKDFSQLLNFSNVFESPEIRGVALARLAKHPDLSAAVLDQLQTGAAYEAIIYLQASPAIQSEQMAQAVRTAIERVAQSIARDISATHTLYVDQGLTEVTRILDVVDKYQQFAVDYGPALQQLRRALDDPRSNQVELRARSRLDGWLATHKKGA